MNRFITKEEIVEFAMQYLNYPGIIYADPELGMTPAGFDCSGFVTFVLKHFGLDISGIRHANEYLNSYGVLVHEEKRQAGDLVSFSLKGHICDHIGIMIDRNHCLHASGKRTTSVALDRYDEVNPRIILQEPHPKYPEAPLLYTRNPIGFKRPIISMQGRYPITLS